MLNWEKGWCLSNGQIESTYEPLCTPTSRKWKVKVKSFSRVWLFATLWTVAYRAPPSMGFSRQEYWSGLPFLLQRIFLTQGLNLDIPYCSQVHYCLSHQGSPHSSSVQFSSVTQSCPTLCDSMNGSTPGLPVHHQLPEFTQTCVHRVSDAIQPSHPRSSPSSPAPNPSQHQSLFQWKSFSEQIFLEFLLFSGHYLNI